MHFHVFSCLAALVFTPLASASALPHAKSAEMISDDKTRNKPMKLRTKVPYILETENPLFPRVQVPPDNETVVINDATTFVRVRPKEITGKDLLADMCVKIIGGRSKFAGKPFACGGNPGVKERFTERRATYNDLPGIDGRFKIGDNTPLPNGVFLHNGVYWA